MTVSNLRLLAELTRITSRVERGATDDEDFDLEARIELAFHDPYLVTGTPCRATEEGARIVAELLATFEEQT